MSDAVLTEMRELVPLEDYELVELIEFGYTAQGGTRLFINGRELPYHLPEDFAATIVVPPAGSGELERLKLELLGTTEIEVRELNLDEPPTETWVQPGLL
jgi:hypothetical protein